MSFLQCKLKIDDCSDLFRYFLYSLVTFQSLPCLISKLLVQFCMQGIHQMSWNFPHFSFEHFHIVKIELMSRYFHCMIVYPTLFLFVAYRSYVFTHPLFPCSSTMSNINPVTIFAIYLVYDIFL